jgi:hypothetical protein
MNAAARKENEDNEQGVSCDPQELSCFFSMASHGAGACT